MLERALGTLAGVAVASLLVTVCHPSDGAIVVLLAGLAAAAYAVYFACYALSSVLLTVLVALLVEFGGGSPIGALGDRAIDTLAGAAIALGVVTVARGWSGRRLTRPGDGVDLSLRVSSRQELIGTAGRRCWHPVTPGSPHAPSQRDRSVSTSAA